MVRVTRPRNSGAKGAGYSRAAYVPPVLRDAAAAQDRIRAVGCDPEMADRLLQAERADGPGDAIDRIVAAVGLLGRTWS